MTDYICAIDQGTTGTKALVLDGNLSIRSRVIREFEQIYPQPSWVEHDPEAIWYSTLEAIAEARQQAGIEPSDIDAIGVTNQRETTVIWDRTTGDPIYNAIVWQDRRTAERLNNLKDMGYEGTIREKTGLLLDPYFSGSKIEWILDHVDGARERARRGELAFGTIDSFLLWRLTGGTSHKTDVSNASRTLLMNLETSAWDPELLELFNVPGAILPTITDSAGELGRVRNVEPLADGTAVAGVAGDQQAALFGQACFDKGQAKCTYGTGAFLLTNTGATPVRSDNRLLTSVGWGLDGELTYVLEGSAFMAGAMVQWLRDELGIIDTTEEVETLARAVEDSGELVVLPSFTGLGAPYWKPDAQGLITGLSRDSSDAHLARATLEGIALQNLDILEAMRDELGRDIHDIRVDGGASSNDLLMQMQADYLDQPITRPEITETTSMGAALLAGLGADIFEDLETLRSVYTEGTVFKPEMDPTTRQRHLERWNRALEQL